MFKVTLPADRAEPDMDAIARAFAISVKDLTDGIHIGMISRWIEVGTGSADNKPHQIFASEKLGIRVDVDEYGNVHSVSEYGTVSTLPQPHGRGGDDASRGYGRTEKSLHSSRKENPDLARRARFDALLDVAQD